MSKLDLKGAKRLIGESFKDYRIRLRREKTILKNYLKGRRYDPKNRIKFQ